MATKTGNKTSMYGNNGTVIPSKSGAYIEAQNVDRYGAEPKVVNDVDLRTKRSRAGKKTN